jgi:hypothetical protein
LNSKFGIRTLHRVIVGTTVANELLAALLLDALRSTISTQSSVQSTSNAATTPRMIQTARLPPDSPGAG